MADIPTYEDAFTLSPRRTDPDAHGQAALLLAESTLHALIESGNLMTNQAVGAVHTATEVKATVAEETGESNAVLQESLGLLSCIELSLKSDEAGRHEPTLSIV